MSKNGDDPGYIVRMKKIDSNFDVAVDGSCMGQIIIGIMEWMLVRKMKMQYIKGKEVYKKK